MVTVVGVEVLTDDVLQVAVLPVEVTRLDRPREHGPVGPARVWGDRGGYVTEIV